MHYSMPGFLVHHQFLELAQTHSIESMMPSNHLILCHPLHLPPSIFPSIRVFPINQSFTSGDQSIGISASASVLPMNIQDKFPLGLTGLISLKSKGPSRVFPWDPQESSSTLQLKIISSQCSDFFIVRLSLPYMTPGKTLALTRWTFSRQSNISAF